MDLLDWRITHESAMATHRPVIAALTSVLAAVAPGCGTPAASEIVLPPPPATAPPDGVELEVHIEEDGTALSVRARDEHTWFVYDRVAIFSEWDGEEWLQTHRLFTPLPPVKPSVARSGEEASEAQDDMLAGPQRLALALPGLRDDRWYKLTKRFTVIERTKDLSGTTERSATIDASAVFREKDLVEGD